MIDFIQTAAKAFVSAAVTAAAYLVAVIPAEGGFRDVSTVQWLGLVLFIGSAFGITYETKNRAATSRGKHRAE